jgi:hypothetical protein
MKTLRTVLSLTSAAALTSVLMAAPAFAQTAPDVASYCQAGAAAFPQGAALLPASAQGNICQWLKDADIAPAKFDAVLKQAAAKGALKTALQSEAELHERNASTLEKSEFTSYSSGGEKAKAAFYDRVSKLAM